MPKLSHLASLKHPSFPMTQHNVTKPGKIKLKSTSPLSLKMKNPSQRINTESDLNQASLQSLTYISGRMNTETDSKSP